VNPFSLVESRVSLLRLPLKRPFTTALGTKTQTVNAVVQVRLASGARGRGEASSSVVWAALTPSRLAAALRTLGRRFHGRDARGLSEEAFAAVRHAAPAASAFECALAEATARAEGISMWSRFGGARIRLRTDLTLSAQGSREAREAARAARREGFRTLKVKVGTGGPAADFARVTAAHRAGGAPRLLLDGNQKLGVTGALRLVDRCLSRGIRAVLLEQPVPADDFSGLIACARRCPIPVAADESLRSVEDARRFADAGVKVAFNVKVAKTGMERSLLIASLAKAAGFPLMIGCMQESAAGLDASFALAAGTGWFRFVDLDSDHLLAGGPAGSFRRDGPLLRLS